MPLPVTFANLPTGNNPASLLDQEFAAVAAMGTTYCTATGANTILLTVAANQPTPTGYANGQQFSFLVPASNTGPVTIQVGSLAAIPLRAAGQPLAAGALIAGTTCTVVVSGNGTSADLVGGSNQPLIGVTNGSNAAAGQVGEVVTATGNVNGVTNGGVFNVLSISLTAGDWDVSGSISLNLTSTFAQNWQAAITTTSATLPAFNAYGNSSLFFTSYVLSNGSQMAVPLIRISVAVTTTVYLVGSVGYSPANTVNLYGWLYARRMR